MIGDGGEGTGRSPELEFPGNRTRGGGPRSEAEKRRALWRALRRGVAPVLGA